MWILSRRVARRTCTRHAHDISFRSACTSSHYSNHTKQSYEKAWFYADDTPYQQWLVGKVENELGLEARCQESHGLSAPFGLVDVGCGTGNFTRAIVRNTDSKGTQLNRILGLDPFLQNDTSTKEPSTSSDRISFLRASAEAWLQDELQLSTGRPASSSQPARESHLAKQDAACQSFFNLFLFKEVIHHFEGDDFERVFQHLSSYLRLGLSSSGADAFDAAKSLMPTEGRAVLITRMHDPSHYPFFEAAKEVWRRNQRPAEEYVERLERVFKPSSQEGSFEHSSDARVGQDDGSSLEVQVSSRIHAFPVEMPLAQWCDMVKSRFWSTLSAFSDEELQRAVREEFLESPEFLARFVQDASPCDDSILRFEEKLVFITVSMKNVSRSL